MIGALIPCIGKQVGPFSDDLFLGALLPMLTKRKSTCVGRLVAGIDGEWREAGMVEW
jgi:hypothetical protein